MFLLTASAECTRSDLDHLGEWSYVKMNDKIWLKPLYTHKNHTFASCISKQVQAEFPWATKTSTPCIVITPIKCIVHPVEYTEYQPRNNLRISAETRRLAALRGLILMLPSQHSAWWVGIENNQKKVVLCHICCSLLFSWWTFLTNPSLI
jgi:hypothetical protein